MSGQTDLPQQVTVLHAVGFASSPPLRELAKLPGAHDFSCGAPDHEQVLSVAHTYGTASDPVEQSIPGARLTSQSD